jgi:hypothetical protein
MKKNIFTLLIVTSCLPVVFASTWYVSPNGSDTNSGTSWADAKKSIQAAIDAASNGSTAPRFLNNDSNRRLITLQN